MRKKWIVLENCMLTYSSRLNFKMVKKFPRFNYGGKVRYRDGRFCSKVGQIAPNGTIRDIFRSDFSKFWIGEAKCTKI